MSIKTIRRIRAGNLCLILFSVYTIVLSAYGLCCCFSEHFDFPHWSIIVLLILLDIIIFWIGIILVYLSSRQLGIKTRIFGILCGPIPILHLIMLFKIIAITSYEAKTEKQLYLKNLERQNDAVCKTKYPLLMVHGVFFRDYKLLNYWGRIPKQLELNGATVFYGQQNSAASVLNSGKELAEKIHDIAVRRGYGKVNIIAHSKGGLDSRAAISAFGCNQYVASLTTINTPHRGCEFADYLLTKLPDSVVNTIADKYNRALSKLGDTNPSFMEAVQDLTAENCMVFNEQTPDSSDVYYQSIGSKLNHPSNGRFPLNFTTRLVSVFDGPNDGLVGEKSFSWGSDYRFLTVTGKRGISHGDVVDLNRENFKGFDVREFYIDLVHELKEKGF